MPDGPPCVFDAADLPVGWKRVELPFGAFYAPSYLGDPVETVTFEGSEFELSTPGMRVIADYTSSITIWQNTMCSETLDTEQRVVWHHFESNRAEAFGHQYLAYLWHPPENRGAAFSLWIQAEDQELRADAERIARSISSLRSGG